MKAPDFRYTRPVTMAEALALLGDEENEASPLAGGQSLVPMMNFRMAQPEILVDLGALKELRGIENADGGLRIGAMTRYAELAASKLVSERAPLVAMALPHIAHAAIRNRGTIGGSVALADPAAEMPAVLQALDARIELVSASGTRTVPASEFFLGMYETALEEGELVAAILLGPVAAERRFGFHELARRHGDYAMAGVTASATARPDGTFVDWRIAHFSVADCAVRATGAEAALEGAKPTDAEALEAAKEALSEIDFSADLNASAKTKRHLAGVVMTRALEGM
ncbi:MAG: xanthine dehydrogenase family protein subunit M [Pseudomonadota bacterium]